MIAPSGKCAIFSGGVFYRKVQEYKKFVRFMDAFLKELFYIIKAYSEGRSQWKRYRFLL